MLPHICIDALKEAAVVLTSVDTRELHSMAADPTSAAAMGILIRILANPHIVNGGTIVLESLVRKLFEWDHPDGMKHVGETVYAMSGDQAGR